MVVTAEVRRKINLLRIYVTAHTIFPTLEQYNTICQTFPKLNDESEEGQSIYVST